MNYFHISDKKLKNNTLIPRVPKSIMDGENSSVKRVCFSSCLAGCYRGLNNNMHHIYSENRDHLNDDILYSGEYYVYVPENYAGKIVKPKEKDVEDVKLSREKWFLDEVNVKCIGKVKFLIYHKKQCKSKYLINACYPCPIKFRWIEKYLF